MSPIDPRVLLSWPFEDVVQTYGDRDTMLYALSLGIGSEPTDPAQLRFVHEKDLLAFPTQAVVFGETGEWARDPATGLDPHGLLHGEESLVLHRPFPASGTLRSRERVTGVEDKGSDALVRTERRIVDDRTGEPVATVQMTLYARGSGGFGGPRGAERTSRSVPATPPDATVDLPTLPQAALLYRLNGDRAALHADPSVARLNGFSRPILHGLCTFGLAARAVVQACCGWDPARLRAIEARFTAPVYPGETVSVELWRRGGAVALRAFVRARDAKVLDRGRAELAA